MNYIYYDVFNKRGYKLGFIISNGLKDPMEVAKQEYGKNVDHLKEWEKVS
jgi:hypothetical protein